MDKMMWVPFLINVFSCRSHMTLLTGTQNHAGPSPLTTQPKRQKKGCQSDTQRERWKSERKQFKLLAGPVYMERFLLAVAQQCGPATLKS